jgi:hypothetical protein
MHMTNLTPLTPLTLVNSIPLFSFSPSHRFPEQPNSTPSHTSLLQTAASPLLVSKFFSLSRNLHDRNSKNPDPSHTSLLQTAASPFFFSIRFFFLSLKTSMIETPKTQTHLRLLFSKQLPPPSSLVSFFSLSINLHDRISKDPTHPLPPPPVTTTTDNCLQF